MIWHLKTAKADTSQIGRYRHGTFVFCEKMQHRSKLVIEYLRFWSLIGLQDSKGQCIELFQQQQFWSLIGLQDSKGRYTYFTMIYHFGTLQNYKIPKVQHRIVIPYRMFWNLMKLQDSKGVKNVNNRYIQKELRDSWLLCVLQNCKIQKKQRFIQMLEGLFSYI